MMSAFTIYGCHLIVLFDVWANVPRLYTFRKLLVRRATLELFIELGLHFALYEIWGASLSFFLSLCFPMLPSPPSPKSLLSIVYRQYRRTAHLNTTHRRRQAFYALPSSHWQMLAEPPFSLLDTFS